MRTLTKMLAALAAAAVVLGFSGGLADGAIAPQAGFSAKGIIEPPNAVSMLAPIGGQVDDFSWVAGDVVAEGDLALALRTMRVVAPGDGVVTALRARAGDRAADIIAQYGALCYIERQDIWHIDASVTATSGDAERRDVRVGQQLRVQHGSGDSKVRAEATVISVSGKDFVLEVEQGDFELEDSIKVYVASSKDNSSSDQIGSGEIVRAPAFAALGDGVVASASVAEGDVVERGQVLFLLDGANARHEPGAEVEPEVRFPQSGVIGEILVAPGQFVEQGQAVMRLFPADMLEATLEVDELDIAKVRVGDAVRIHVDAHRQERAGIVREIRPIGKVVLDTTKFLVRVSFEKSDDLMIGMHVTAYWD